MLVKLVLFLVLQHKCFSESASREPINEAAFRQSQDDSSSSSQPSLSVLLISTWLTGHQNHLLGVGGELVKRGHKVSFLSTEVKGSNNLPHVPERLGMKFISAGPDPKTKEEYEMLMSSLKGQGIVRQRLAVIEVMQEHLYQLRVAIDALNCSDWDIVLVDYLYSMNLVRHLTLTCNVKIMLSLSTILDYVSMAPPWPYPSNLLAISSDDISLYHKIVSAFYQLVLSNSIGTLLTKYYLMGNDTEMWKLIHSDPYFFYPPDVLYPVLYYSVVGVEYAHPHYPNVHMVGPILLDANDAPLQNDLRIWLDAKEHGSVVYVSMGTTAILTKEMAIALLTGIEQAGYNMLWSLRKTNREIIDGIELDSDRFFVAEWVSQVAALQHSAVGLAVLHCGAGGLHEALSNSVPIICIPFAFDQFSWAGKIQVQGVGVALFGNEVTTDRVVNSIQKVSSVEFRERVRKLSKVLKCAGGSKKAAELVEYYADVGYDHLLPAYVKYRWGWMKYYNLDMCCLFLLTALCGLVPCCRLCACFKSNKQQNSVNKNKHIECDTSKL